MWCVWSARGGAGCSVVVAGAALLTAQREPVLAVDLAGGDLPSLLGVGNAALSPVGVSDWLGEPDPPDDALGRMEVEVADNLRVLSWAGPRSINPPEPPSGSQLLQRLRLLGRRLADDPRPVIVDVGSLRSFGWLDWSAGRVVVMEAATRRTLVTRLCYGAATAALDHPRPDDMIVVAEPGRALRPDDVADALGVGRPTVLRWDPAVARAADSGLLAQRLPRLLRRIPIEPAAAPVRLSRPGTGRLDETAAL